MSINKKLHPISRDVMSYNYIFIVDTKKSPPMWGLMVAAHGFEPRTHRVWTDCSSQLSYAAMYGASDRDWTGDLILTKDTLCRLSYTSTMNVHFTVKLWLRGQDLNLRPSGYEPDELPTAPPRDVIFNEYGGGRGIRTPATLSRPVGFQDRSLQPDLGIPPFFHIFFW